MSSSPVALPALELPGVEVLRDAADETRIAEPPGLVMGRCGTPSPRLSGILGDNGDPASGATPSTVDDLEGLVVHSARWIGELEGGDDGPSDATSLSLLRVMGDAVTGRIGARWMGMGDDVGLDSGVMRSLVAERFRNFFIKNFEALFSVCVDEV